MALSPAFCSSMGFLSVPSELFTMIISHLKVRHLKQLMESNKAVYSLVAPVFYRKVWTKRQTYCDTAGLVSLLRRRPEICQLISVLIIDEMDETGFRELLGLELPNLETINVEHAHGTIKTISAERREELNAVVRLKPRLSSFKLAVLDGCKDVDAVPTSDDEETALLYKIQAQDFVFFNHPTLTRLKLAHLDLSAFRKHPTESLPMAALKHLEIDDCHIHIASLGKFLKRATSLLSFRFRHHRRLSFCRSSFVSLLSGCKETLETLELCWRSSLSHYDLRGPMLFEEFTALKLLLVDPQALFVNYLGSTNLLPMLRHVLPQNLEVLILEGVAERANQQNSERDHLDQPATIGQADGKLLSDIIRLKGDILPHLRHILVCDCFSIENLDRFYEMADTQSVRLGMLNTQIDQPVPKVELLDSSWAENASDTEKGTGYQQARYYDGRGWV
ncbi:hypothetical protein CGCSCA4_v004155 [Colletotrichum siamense]|uniref:F-box domain-containing protein n=1 Tax=Colletotrichum siamense TaxID=690259 RepID=A0A9P5EZS6_COLSI|nr:hypothetical protein CGCSCA4_v004155 [Colletotrichum siamense]KAF4863261.1 hypothetical protein CGCSCA2_v002988 [Colletotrichum siamense]